MNYLNNKSFLEGTKLQIAWDSTSLSALKKCPRYYYYTIIVGLQESGENEHLTFGTLYHRGLEIYHHLRSSGASWEEAVRIAIKNVLIDSWDKELQRPSFTGTSQKNRFTLVRTLVWYLDQFREDTIETIIFANGKPAVEVSFRFELPYKIANTSYVYCGHIDRIGRFQDEHNYILDPKTTLKTLNDFYFNTFSPNNQFTGYVAASKIVLGIEVKGIICDAAQVTVDFSRFQRRIIERSSGIIDEWMESLQFYLESAERYEEKEMWPMNETACFNCSFREICSIPPRRRDAWLKGFIERKWDPLTTRGDV